MQTKKQNRDPGQWLGWLVFLLVIAGAPLLNVFQQVTGLPVPSYALPGLIGIAVVLNVVISLLRMANIKTYGDMRLPNGSEAPAQPSMPVLPLPPFGEPPFARPFVTPTTIATDMAQSQALPGKRTTSSSLPQALSGTRTLPQALSGTRTLPSTARSQALPGKISVPPIQTPRFEPVISPTALIVSVIGLVLLMALGLAVMNF